MSLVKCHECGQNISTSAASCPSCGAKRKSAASVLVASIAAIGFGLVSAVVAGTVFVMNGYQSFAVPGLIAFIVGALVGWRRVLK